ncbi:MAG: hypothetical protein KatS3mg110_4273 [Pirellulaceae bacterium]|nr:MAG: hypothetical protein KatS3mg110_4273 [Pirellulaceae bacterium]
MRRAQAGSPVHSVPDRPSAVALLLSLVTHLAACLLVVGLVKDGAKRPEEFREGRRVPVVLLPWPRTPVLPAQKTVEGRQVGHFVQLSTGTDSVTTGTLGRDAQAALPALPETIDWPSGGRQVEALGVDGGRPTRQLATDRPYALPAPEESVTYPSQTLGEPVSVSLFGSPPLHGGSFVFLVDCSASMGPAGLNVLPAVRRELATVLDQLSDKQWVCCASYQDRLDFPFGRQLAPLQPGQRDAYKVWIAQWVALGGTNHEAALYAGLELAPQWVVLLTDAQDPVLGAATRRQIMRRAVQNGCRIGCIEFGRGPAAALSGFRELAEGTGGVWRYVDVERLER